MTMKNTYIKLISILLVLVFVLCSCQSQQPDSEKPSNDDTTAPLELDDPEDNEEDDQEETTEDTSEQEPPVVLVGDQKENENYKDITPRDISDYKYVSFLTNETEEVLCLKVPSDWEIDKKNDSSYSIIRGGSEIGELFLGKSTDYEEWQSVAKEDTDVKNFNMTQHIDKYGQGNTLKFRYRYSAESVASDGELFVTLTVDYAELNAKAAFNIFKSSTFESRKEAFKVGTVPEAKNGKILIIGNSFISTSNIGEILTEMMQRNGKSTQVEAISRGMATVATYVNDSYLMSEIESGVYKAVFACGLYDSREEVNNLRTLKSACDCSNTTLVIFPAHNETTSIVTLASQRLSSVLMLNWQQEINDLIDDGRDKWDFCEDDTYKHSKPIAGYVGAHMIYRAIHGEMPSGRLSSSISQTEVNSLLGDYVRTGCAKGALYTLK